MASQQTSDGTRATSALHLRMATVFEVELEDMLGSKWKIWNSASWWGWWRWRWFRQIDINDSNTVFFPKTACKKKSTRIFTISLKIPSLQKKLCFSSFPDPKVPCLCRRGCDLSKNQISAGWRGISKKRPGLVKGLQPILTCQTPRRFHSESKKRRWNVGNLEDLVNTGHNWNSGMPKSQNLKAKDSGHFWVNYDVLPICKFLKYGRITPLTYLFGDKVMWHRQNSPHPPQFWLLHS